jgi:hypothetical protein
MIQIGWYGPHYVQSSDGLGGEGRMSAHGIALTVHVSAGSAGLVLGPAIMLVPKRHGIHTKLGEAYHWVFGVLFVSAVSLAVLNPSVWWLGLVGAGSYGLALRGYLAAKRRRPGWILAHISGQGGSYIAMTTALTVVNWNALTDATGFLAAIPWFLPTAIGSPLIAWVSSQVALGRRPRTWARRAAGEAAGPVRREQPARS